MAADALRPYQAFLVDHLYVVAFMVAAIDATGFPIPGRLLLVAAGALAAGGADAAWVILLAAAGAVAGDHALFLAGWVGGDRLLRLHCRWTMGSRRCIDQTRDYFRRFGAVTILIGRFVGGARIFAAALAGSGAIRYHEFLLFEALGAFVWASALVLLGYFLGEGAMAIAEGYGGVTVLLGLAVAGLAGILAYRLWKRRRHGRPMMARASRGRN